MWSYLIVNTKTNAVHREPGRRSYDSDRYASEAAAKAGITRTVKYYQKAIDDVASLLNRGESKFRSLYYNSARNAIEHNLADRSTYRVMHSEEYILIEPHITRTGICPGTGEEITYTSSINEPHYMSPLSESYWSA